MSDDKAKIIEKVQKLHGMAKSAEDIGSLEEAKVFAAKVKKMMDEHKLSMSDIAYEEYSEADIQRFCVRWSEYGYKDTTRRCQWTSSLCGRLAEYNSCRMFICQGTNACMLYGREEDIAAMKTLLYVLVPVLIVLDEAAYHKIYWEVRPPKSDMSEQERKGILKGFRLSWKLGFVDGVFDALKMQQEEDIEEAEDTEFALVRIHQGMVAVNNHITEITEGKKIGTLSHKGSRRHKRGYGEGHEAGTAAVNRDRVEG